MICGMDDKYFKELIIEYVKKHPIPFIEDKYKIKFKERGTKMKDLEKQIEEILYSYTVTSWINFVDIDRSIPIKNFDSLKKDLLKLFKNNKEK